MPEAPEEDDRAQTVVVPQGGNIVYGADEQKTLVAEGEEA